jgi:hypothetical protein
VKIAALRTAVVGTPWRNLTFVELRTDEGLTGVGEVRILGHTDALRGEVPERLNGRDWKSRDGGQPRPRVRIPPSPLPAPGPARSAWLGPGPTMP